ncbi:radical SAM domain protein [Candidatus Moduliflexus flocculans]|uniref:Radical SAM domain protein n=1 Tax=Candidatus Moduliflexus flocculans TaxID=1499966 RepID=A0A081BLC1_9BACT|nr:radical SAM domain protein [Candidatus Moduliflexus flocculans]
MSAKITILFVQLPIPRLKITVEDHNIPVAALYLQAYLREQELAQRCEFRLLDPFLQNYGADEVILREIRAIAPDVICFSLFCWNVERSLYMAEQVKLQSPAPLIFAGGPEVTPDNELLRHSAIDAYVYGEGELTLQRLLESYLATGRVATDVLGTLRFDGAWHIQPPQTRAIDINAVRSAYLQGLVPPGRWQEMYIETMRGCPFACRFCYYNKQCGDTRFLQQEAVLDLVRHALAHDYSGLFLLDPSFNIRPDLETLLRKIAALNPERKLKIATELRADMVDEHLAQLLADAGMYEVELGLQSIHRDTMRQIGRTQSLKKFLRGARAMLAQGIETKVDLIVGLPGDDLDKFKASARWVKREGLDGYLQVFCLSVLPGTHFRAHASELGLNYSPLPPYYLLSSPGWTPETIQEAFAWAEDYFDMAFEPDIDDECSLTPVLEGRLQEIVAGTPAQPPVYPRHAASLTKWHFSELEREDDLLRLLPILQQFTHNNPQSTYFVYLELTRPIAIDALIDFYAAAASLRQRFIDRDLGVLTPDETPIFHYRLDILLREKSRKNFPEQYLIALQEHFYVEWFA